MPSVTSSSARSKKQQGSRASVTGYMLTRLALVFSAVSFIAATLIVQFEAHAAPPLALLKNAGETAWGLGAETSIGGIVGSIIVAVLGLLGVIFVVLLTYGGFLWLTSAGEEEKTKTATHLIANAIIGLLIVVAAYSIAYFILSRLGQAVVQ